MIILFALDGDNVELKFPLSCDASTTLRQALASLRAKLRAGSSVTIDIRTRQGLPVPLSDSVGSVKEKQQARDKAAGSNPKAYAELYALLDGPQKAVRQCLVNAARDRKHENPAVSEDVGSSSDDDDLEEDYRRFTSDEDPRLKNNNKANSSSGKNSSAASTVPGLHFIRINGKFQKGYTLNDVAWGAPIATEVPVMSLVYQTQLAEAVANSEKLRSRTYDPNASAGESSMRGVDNETFAKYVSIAKTHGHLIKTSDKYGTHVALYPEISCLRHSCTPNAVFRRAIVKPYRGVVRCAQPSGLLAGEEVTVLLPGVNTLLFMLLPRERRQKLLQERYHFTCDCSRCWKQDDASELTLSGAFFGGEAKKNTTLQKKLTNEMREEFENLHIFNTKDVNSPVDTPVGAKIPKSPHALLQFVSKYTANDAPLRLHRNHWRVSVVRVAYLKQAAFVLSAQKQSKAVPVRPFLEQRSFEIALQQLTTESLFVPKGHPYYVSSFAIYKKMMAILPTNLVAALQAKSRRYVIEWEAVLGGFSMWEGARGSDVSGADLRGSLVGSSASKPSMGVQKSAAQAQNNKAKPKCKKSRGHSDENDNDNYSDSSYSSDGEPVIPEEMRRQYIDLYGEDYVKARERDIANAGLDDAEEGRVGSSSPTEGTPPVDHDDDECEANVAPFVSQNKNKENIFVVRDREEAEEAAFLAEHANEEES